MERQARTGDVHYSIEMKSMQNAQTNLIANPSVDKPIFNTKANQPLHEDIALEDIEQQTQKMPVYRQIAVRHDSTEAFNQQPFTP